MQLPGKRKLGGPKRRNLDVVKEDIFLRVRIKVAQLNILSVGK